MKFGHRPMLLAVCVVPLLSGCISTAASIVTAPVRVAGKAVDWTTTSQSESDRNLGRRVRKQQAELGRIDRQYQKHLSACRRGDQHACDLARQDYEQIQAISPSVPNQR
ncbi:hypothetical protein [Novosphingobium sp. Leaf2]|uniref:hypothetical protein n=1 Tax=Novosphingobium sp. Leaf2 TaxID=1735670 RepID=UPI0006FB063F|nr:hypothetical protein [Novosphingobium sp. Leaf2]KQM21841.1 hypothetical protein ASE49_00525 [Novosphingobium sp. Leaf2]